MAERVYNHNILMDLQCLTEELWNPAHVTWKYPFLMEFREEYGAYEFRERLIAFAVRLDEASTAMETQDENFWGSVGCFDSDVVPKLFNALEASKVAFMDATVPILTQYLLACKTKDTA